LHFRATRHPLVFADENSQGILCLLDDLTAPEGCDRRQDA
jgi:hypothetical protein